MAGHLRLRLAPRLAVREEVAWPNWWKCLSLFFSVCQCLSVFVSVCQCLSVFLSVSQCFSLLVSVSLYSRTVSLAKMMIMMKRKGSLTKIFVFFLAMWLFLSVAELMSWPSWFLVFALVFVLWFLLLAWWCNQQVLIMVVYGDCNEEAVWYFSAENPPRLGSSRWAAKGLI